MVLWKEALSSLRGGSKGSETSDTYDLVFSNKTVLDPVRALPSLLLSDSLKPLPFNTLPFTFLLEDN